jgi:hypothetical protein
MRKAPTKTLTRAECLIEAQRLRRLEKRERRAGRATNGIVAMAAALEAQARIQPWKLSAVCRLAKTLTPPTPAGDRNVVLLYEMLKTT